MVFNFRDNELVKVSYPLLLIFITQIFSQIVQHIEPIPVPIIFIIIYGLIWTVMLPFLISILLVGIIFLFANFKRTFRPTFKLTVDELNVRASIIMTAYYLGYALMNTTCLVTLSFTIISSYIGTYLLLKVIIYIRADDELNDIVFDASEIKLKQDYD